MKCSRLAGARQLGWCLSILALLLAGGCGDARRQSVEGTVTFEGQPLAEGHITFVPQGTTHGPTAGTEIKDGHFSIDREKGSFAGTFRVEIVAARETGRSFVDPTTDETVTEREQYLPAKYNSESELTAEIKEGEPNRLEFNLTAGGSR